MASNDLFNYMRDATHLMQSEYERIQKRAAEDPGTAGDNGEENWAQLLRKWLPKSYHVVTKGRIMNQKGECGPQVDVLILSPAYPEALIAKKEYLEGGVLAAFECKLTLKAEHVRAAVRTAAEIRRLSSYHPEGTPYKELHPTVLFGLLAHSHCWQGENSNPITNIAAQLQEESWKVAQHPAQMIDFIFVSDLACWRTGRFITPSVTPCPTHVPKQLWNTWVQAGGSVAVDHMCLARRDGAADQKGESFTPIGHFLVDLYRRLSGPDKSLRPLYIYISRACKGRTSNYQVRELLSGFGLSMFLLRD